MPATITVRESKGEGARSITVEYEFGRTLERLAKIIHEDTVFSAAVATFTADLRKMVRARLKAGESDQAILDAVKAWKPANKGGDPVVARINQLMDKLPGDKQAALLQRFGAKAS